MNAADELPKSSAHRIWWQMFALVAISAVAVLVGLSFDEEIDKFLPEPKILVSIYNKKPSGTSSLLEIAQATHLPYHVWKKPYRLLPGIKGMLVIMGPLESLDDFECEQILSWVSKGNSLIYIDDFAFKMNQHLLDKLGLKAKMGTALKDAQLPLTKSFDESYLVKSLTVTADTRLVGGSALLGDKSGSIFTELKKGDGRVLMGSAPTLCSNRRLGNKDSWSNYQFLINWLSTAPGTIYFDERCHGYSAGDNVFAFLLQGATGLVFMQFVVILIVAILSNWQRFGAARKLDERRKLSNLEFIDGLAGTYRRAKARGAALEIIGQSLKGKVCKLLGVNAHESTSKVIELWKDKAQGKELPEFLEDYEAAIKKKTLSDKELKSLVESCDKIANDLSGLITTRESK